MAIADFEQLLTDTLAMLGQNHPYTPTVRGNLACWRGYAGDISGATSAFEQLLIDRQRIFGRDHPQTATTYRILEYWRGLADRPNDHGL